MEDRITHESISASGVVVIARAAENICSTGEVYVVNEWQPLNSNPVRGWILNDIDDGWVGTTCEVG